MHSRMGAVTKLLFGDLLGSVVWFPVWWYTQGLTLVIQKAIMALQYRARAYALGIWIRNLFVPMYGQRDLAGRAVSVFMRIVVLVGRGFALVVEGVVYLFGIVLWCMWIPLTLVLCVMNIL